MNTTPPFSGTGDPRAQCDRCGGVFHLSALRRDGQTRGALMVCSRCHDPIHPQEKIRVRPERQPPPNTRHVPTYSELTFIDPDNPVRPEDL